jgi:hypothetical protein
MGSRLQLSLKIDTNCCPPQQVLLPITSIVSNRLVESLLTSYPSIARSAHRLILLLASDRSRQFLPAAFRAKTQATLPLMCRYSEIRLHYYGY